MIVSKNELFGEEDIVHKNENRTHSAKCLSGIGILLMIKKRETLILCESLLFK